MDRWTEKYTNPPMEYRPHPFWSWNEDMEEEELRRQIRLFAEAGRGGFFMHARDGIITPYMGEKWFDLIRACADEAEKCGLEAWCYDENGWPSGSAGGLVPGKGKKYCRKWLRFSEIVKEGGEVLGEYAVAEGRTSFRVFDGTLRDGETKMFAVTYHDGGYIDILDPEVVAEFIRVTYDRYKDETGDMMEKKLLHGFFTDEPQYALCKTPWTNVAFEEFEKSYGYSLRDNLPTLFLDVEGYEGVRYDFWMMINRLFTESFAKQIYEWCEEHHCKFTGHAMMEDNTICQMHCTAGPMPMYEYMHIPGVDHLGKLPQFSRNDRTGAPVIPLQLGSVAAQLGKKQVLTETYALSGWDASFADMKYLADWQFLYGINLMCEHLAPYSMRGTRKNDFPAGLSYQSAFWDKYKVMSDYLARTGMLLSDGVDDPGVLVIHPIHSLYPVYNNDRMNEMQPFDSEFNALTRLLCDLHIPHHYGDETIMCRHGNADHGILTIGDREYSVVVLPHLLGLDRSTYDLLMRFVKGGGRLAVMGEKPYLIGGRPAEEELKTLFEYAENVVPDDEHILKYFRQCGMKNVSVVNKFGEDYDVHVSVRKYPEDGRTVYFVLNVDRKSPHEVELRVDDKNAVGLNTETMEFYGVEQYYDSVRHERVISLSLAPMESKIIVCDYREMIEAESTSDELIPVKLSRKWTLGEGCDLNSYMIENCRIIYGDKESNEVHVWKASRTISNDEYLTAPVETVGVRYGFDCRNTEEYSDSMRLVLEFTPPVSVKVNGTVVEALPGEWWLDHGFSVYDISSAVHNGHNTVDVTGFVMREADKVIKTSDIGYAYIRGDFGVYTESGFIPCDNSAELTYGPFVLNRRTRELDGGNITIQGHSFFRGKLVLEQKFNVNSLGVGRELYIPRPHAGYTVVKINGKGEKLFTGTEIRYNITDLIAEGENTLTLEMCISNRNLLGPHHLGKPESYSVGPEDFIPAEPSKWKKTFAFVKAGIID